METSSLIGAAEIQLVCARHGGVFCNGVCNRGGGGEFVDTAAAFKEREASEEARPRTWLTRHNEQKAARSSERSVVGGGPVSAVARPSIETITTVALALPVYTVRRDGAMARWLP